MWFTRKSKSDFLPQLLPKKFSYSQIRSMTKNFSTKLGNGGFGQVYEGFLKDGSRVAVKVLKEWSTQGEKEFKAEVISMAGIHHKNVIPFKGYCTSRRILVYEFMVNGSLDKWLFAEPGKERLLDWPKRYEIAVGMARGLTYLHEECTQQIIHLDIKPENILLDENFSPKVTDFGLSKLVDRDKARVVTNMRGTPGYLAPEWLNSNAPVSTKVDVYSFGIVLLELICGRESFQISSSKSSEEWYLPPWASKLVAEGRGLELVDTHLNEEVEYFYQDQANRAIQTALCCIQQDPSNRPSMSRVLQMLEGVIDVPRIPTKQKTHQTADERVREELKAFTACIKKETTLRAAFDASDRSTGTSSTDFNLSDPDIASRTPLRWPLRGDIVNIQVSDVAGDFVHAVVRDVKPQQHQVKLGILYKIDTANRWGVIEEEARWRNWSVLVSTLRHWTAVKWVTVPGPVGGYQRLPVEWIAAKPQLP
ncbi:G-type lectin S-receptor-like serine/threonine-protein kinase SD2-5 [Selaginella moellendorffii]|nr:G-type lectin S-receptor-like serine/threonine-protein kinase SD2-5 [Selaginella moellendorffii]|eukprot:XP_002968897.2 G-type lectin S-receptor-like serine/threonine-protein kinase SD2-5 [Selaginella moellendorffii]